MPSRKRTPDPLAIPAIVDALGRTVSPTKGRKRRAPGERRDERMVYLSTVRMDAVAHALLRLAAAQRAVSMNTLVSDVLVLWMQNALDPRQGAARKVTGGKPLPQVPERFAGYHASLGYAPPASGGLTDTATSLPPRDPLAPPPTLPPAEAMAQVLREEAAIAKGIQETAPPPPPQFEMPPEDAPAPPANPFGHLKPGVGNAAQAWEMGFAPLPGALDYRPSHARSAPTDPTDTTPNI